MKSCFEGFMSPSFPYLFLFQSKESPLVSSLEYPSQESYSSAGLIEAMCDVLPAQRCMLAAVKQHMLGTRREKMLQSG